MESPQENDAERHQSMPFFIVALVGSVFFLIMVWAVKRGEVERMLNMSVNLWVICLVCQNANFLLSGVLSCMFALEVCVCLLEPAFLLWRYVFVWWKQTD